VPISASLTYFPSSRFPNMAEQLKNAPSITAALNAYGIKDYRRGSTRIFTRFPMPSEATALRNATSSGHRGDRYRFERQPYKLWAYLLRWSKSADHCRTRLSFITNANFHAIVGKLHIKFSLKEMK